MRQIMCRGPGKILAIAGISLAIGTPCAHAVFITNGAGAILFADDFENSNVGAEPIAVPSVQTGPEVGTWAGTSTFTHVESPAADNDPKHPSTTHDGLHYLRLPRYLSSDPNDPYPGQSPQYQLGANFGTVTSGTISAAFSMYIPSTDADFPVGIGLSSQASYLGSLAYIEIKPQTDRKVYFNDSVSSSNLISGVTYQTDTWQLWRIDYTFVPGSHNDTWTVTVGGVTSSIVAATSAGDGAHDGDPTASTFLSYLVFRGDNNGATAFIDGVPEPASMGVLALGGLLMRRRKQ